jgi:hypothetical protein
VATAAFTKTDIQEADQQHLPIAALEVEDPSYATTRGQVQTPQYRDKWFGIFFLLHLFAMIFVAILFAMGVIHVTINDTDDEDTNEDVHMSTWEEVSFLSTLVISMILSIGLALTALSLMFSHAVRLIQGSLVLGIILNSVLCLVSLIANLPSAVLFGIFALILACYAKTVWHRIPFCAANLKMAVTCVKANMGMTGLSLMGGIPITAAWWALWLYITICTMQSDFMSHQLETIQVTDDDLNGSSTTHDEQTFSPLGLCVWAMLLLSLYWTLQVISNTIHITVAGTVGTWWFLPMEANSCCSNGLTESMGRTFTYSFGSICLGSLIVAIIQVIRALLRSASGSSNNNRGGAGIVRCIAECVLVWIERIAEYFNKWAFIYVGLYGYGYIEAGKNVIQLFKQRGWTTIISDTLVHRMLGMMCFGIGLINALVAALLTLMETRDGAVIGVTAFSAFVVGILLSSLVFQIVGSSVDTIIVLYAEAPNECQQNHPDLARDMNETWT